MPLSARTASLLALALHFSVTPTLIHWSLRSNPYRTSSAVVLQDVLKVVAGIALGLWQATQSHDGECGLRSFR